MRKTIKAEIDDLLEETTRLDFPFLSNLDKKKKILNDRRMYIESEMKAISGEKYPSQDVVDEIWDKSIRYADEKFMSLPENKRLNGFYLQELMHYYVEQLGKIILLEN
jgi:hypothetical protein